jgi:hypothetical protein
MNDGPACVTDRSTGPGVDGGNLPVFRSYLKADP